MQPNSQPLTTRPSPIALPSAPILPARRLVFANGSNLAPDHTPSEPPSKKRKKDRACDYCRRRKIRCDGPWRQDQVCTNCALGHRHCTYVETSKPRGPSKAYVTALEDRVEQLEGMIKQLRPGTDFSEELGPPVIRGSWKNATSGGARHPPGSSVPRLPSNRSSPVLTLPDSTAMFPEEFNCSTPPVGRTTHLIFQPPRNISQRSSHTRRRSMSKSSVSSSSSSSSNESSEETVETGRGGRQRLTLSAMEAADETQPDSRIRFHGRSSTAGLVEVTRKFKHLCLQEEYPQPEDHTATGGTGGSSHRTYILRPSSKPANEELQVFRRLEFWSTPKWELEWESHNIDGPHLIAAVLRFFPSDDVANRLFDLFFRHTNTYLPLLHRPTFERQWRNQLHHSNIWFAIVCILMFAVASRWYAVGGEAADDSTNGGEDWKAIGWRWFFVALDTFALMVFFLRGTTCGPVGWLFVSIGIRKALDRGAHRRKVYKSSPNADDELWKRAFWILVAFDHILSASMGRGIAVNEEDHDLDLPLEVDDEYWETGNPETDFKQPVGIPSNLACFTQFIKLVRIIAFMTKTLYPIDKSKVLCGFVRYDWTGEAVQQLKLAMDEWIQNVPAHLRWSEDIMNSTFAHQSSSIHALYHLVQMTIWRPFCVYNPGVSLRLSDKKTTSAMGHCAISIRACARILESEMALGISNIPIMINSALVCAGMVAMILWELQRKLVADGKGKLQVREFEIEGTGVYVQELLDDMRVCTRMLELTKLRWEWAETVLNKLNDALPTDTGESFESLDIPMPSMDEISNFMRVPADFDDHPDRDSTSTLRDLQDGTIPSVGHHRTNAFQSRYFRPTGNRDLMHTSSHGIGASNQTNKPSLSSAPNQTQPSQRHSGVLYPQTSRPSTPAFPSFTRPLTHEHHHNFHLHNYRSISRAFSGIGPRSWDFHFQLPDHQPPTFYDRSHGSTDQGFTKQPDSHLQETDRLARCGDTRSPQCHALSSDHSDTPSIPGRFVMVDKSAQRHLHQPRTHTMSLISSPFPSATIGREIPCISNSLRRTSYPNLKKDGQTPPMVGHRFWTTADIDDSCKGIAQPLSSSLPRVNQEPSTLSQPINQLPKPKLKIVEWDDSMTYASPEDNHMSNRKTIRTTGFRHWNKRPLPPPREDCPRYTQHRFVNETPINR